MPKKPQPLPIEPVPVLENAVETEAACRVQRSWRRYRARYSLERYRYERWLEQQWSPEKLMSVYADLVAAGLASSLGPTAEVPGRHLDPADPLSTVDLTVEVAGASLGPLAHLEHGRPAAASWHLRRAAAGEAAVYHFLVDRTEGGCACRPDLRKSFRVL